MKKKFAYIFTIFLFICLLAVPMRTNAATISSKVGAVTTKVGALNVRASASSGAAVISSLPKGSYITLLSKNNTWWEVEYANNKVGYCHADYITVVQGSPVIIATQSGSLNVRSGAGTSYTRIASLPKGTIVLRLTQSGGWSRILYHGVKTGYVSSSYLSESTSTGNAVSLNVPNYKQLDSRWANVKIGSSGKTIGQIGCATTGIAMMESYRTGTTIYPDAMSKKLNYTSSGSVYWPENFIAVTSSSNYLSNIMQLLKQGKPVLLGAKNSYGGQHWVVVTGFTGGSLSAGNFIINDPGTSTRTTLQQFLNAYPTFYKYFYY